MKKVFCLLLCLLILCSCAGDLCAAWLLPEQWSAPKAVLYASSDFQYPDRVYRGVTYPSSYDAGAAVMKDQLKALKQDYPAVDEALFLGDYEPSYYTNRSEGIDALKQTLKQTWSLSDERIWLLQGNHDHYDTPGLDGAKLVFTTRYDYSGKHGSGYIVPVERQYYSLCLIHEDAFPESFISDTAALREMKRQVVQETAKALETYLTKTLSGSPKPVIVLGHIPLHYSRQDNIYARYLVEAMNAGAAAGRNIIYLFGHNHSGSYDNYLGGSCIYYPSGSTLHIPDPVAADQGKNTFVKLRCDFTYLNPGYIGFIGSTEQSATLSSTVLEIYEDRVEFVRYNGSGVVNMKNPGCSGITAAGTKLPVDTEVRKSPQTMRYSTITVETTDGLLPTLPPDAFDTVRLKVSGTRGDPDVRWESEDDSVASVTGWGTTARVTAHEYGTVWLRAKVSDSTGGCCMVYYRITVCPDEAVTFTDIPTETAFRLVTDWTTIRPDKEYMILNTDRPGTATAFAGATAQGERVKNGKLGELVTHPQVVELFGDGNYTFNTHDYDYWSFQKWPFEGTGEYLLICQNQVFTGASNHFDPAVKGYGDITGLYMGSNRNSAGTIGWVIDPQAKRIDLALYRVGGDSVQTFAQKTGYSLYYNRQQDHFELAQSGEQVYLYEKIHLDLSQVRLWVQGQGNLVAGQTETDARIMVLFQGKLITVPLTASMLSGMDLSVPGSGTCTVTYLDKVITEHFPLTVWEADAKTLVRTVSVRDVYFRSDTLHPGKQYALFSRETPGEGYALSMEPLEGSWLSTVAPAEIFCMEDGVYGAVETKQCGFIPQRAKPDSSRFLLKSSLFEGYLDTLWQRKLTLTHQPSQAERWKPFGGGLVGQTMGICSAGPVFFPSQKGATASLYRLDETRQLLTYGYLTAAEGTVKARDFGAPMYPGGNMVLVHRMSNDSDILSRTEIPITVTMLRGITLKDLMTPGIYHGSVWYGQTQLCSDYTLTVT